MKEKYFIEQIYFLSLCVTSHNTNKVEEIGTPIHTLWKQFYFAGVP